jgi:hypothetical protein
MDGQTKRMDEWMDGWMEHDILLLGFELDVL